MTRQACSASPPHPDFSLVVATVDPDGQLLRALLTSLQASADPGFEVIVVDQNAGRHLQRLVAEFEDAMPIRYLRLSSRGASAARNAGAELARGRWISFPDDDCRYHADTLTIARRVLEADSVRIATGRTVDEALQPSVLRWGRQARDFDRWSMFGCLTEATLFVDQALFRAVGGFDARFGPGAAFPAAEGVELMDRMLRAAGCGRARFDPAIQMYHPDKIPPWNRWAVGRFFQYAQGDGAFVARAPRAHTLWWVARTLASAGLHTLAFRGWASVAHAARIAGIGIGICRYAFARVAGLKR